MSKIGLLDMDGTLYDYVGQLRRDLVPLMSPGESVPDDLWDEGLPWIKARMDMIKSLPGWWYKLPRLSLGWQVYDMAEGLEFEIHILTKGPATKSRAWAEKHRRIVKDFGDKAVTNIVGGGKGSYYGTFLCDDYPPYLIDWLRHRPRGLGVMIAHDYNKDFTHPNVIRFDGTNRTEVEDALKAVASRSDGEHWKDRLG